MNCKIYPVSITLQQSKGAIDWCCNQKIIVGQDVIIRDDMILDEDGISLKEHSVIFEFLSEHNAVLYKMLWG